MYFIFVEGETIILSSLFFAQCFIGATRERTHKMLSNDHEDDDNNPNNNRYFRQCGEATTTTTIKSLSPDDKEVQVILIQKITSPYPRYRSLENRLKSFKEWSISLTITPKELSQAGFFYTGCNDRVICLSLIHI